jgi:uncharacterized membrane protein YjfL (UPF0719 family)
MNKFMKKIILYCILCTILFVILYLGLALYKNIILQRNNKFEGYMSIIGPVIIPRISLTAKPRNTYYKNMKITQDFDKDNVITSYKN